MELEVRPLDSSPGRTLRLEGAEGRPLSFAEGALGVPALRTPAREACRHNPFVEQAREALESLDLPRAVQHLQRALTSPESCVEGVTSIHLLRGFTAALEGQHVRAAQELRIALEVPLLEADEAEYFVVLMERWSGWLATAGAPRAPHRLAE